MQQNHVSVVRKLLLRNTSETDLKGLTISITSEPEFAMAWEHQVDVLKAGESFEVDTVHLKVSAPYLSNLSERVSGIFTLTVSAGSEPLFTGNYPVSVLAYDEWGGAAILPEMVAAFITPNHAEVLKIIRRAAPILERWTGDPSFNEYQSRNPDRVRKQMAALYEAVAELQLVYCSVPASFEETGQRVRMCDTIFAHKLANCLDISLL
ncbi:DNA helicase, partial [Rufibacter latericius]